MKTLAIIDSAVQSPVIECFNSISALTRFNMQYHLPALFGVESLSRLKEADVIFLLGSASSVNDNLDWQKALMETVAERVENDIPVLGVCFGHQLLAHMYGGRVGHVREDKDKLLGTRVLKFERRFSDFNSGDEIELAVTHREHVKELPKNFQVLASSEGQSFDMIQHQSKAVVGIQPHPEASLHFAKNIIKEFDFHRYNEIQSNGKKIITNFLKFAHLGVG